MDPITFKDYSGHPDQSIRSKIIEFIQTLVVFLAIGTAVYLFIAQPHKVSGSSMFQTLHDGDYIITNKISYRFSEPKKGEIIVFKDPGNSDEDYIKRIIGKEGDVVKLSTGKVFVNGEAIREPYLGRDAYSEPGAFLAEDQEVIVPQNHFFVLGDNRIASSDSRQWGFIGRDEIIGKALIRYWPINYVGLIKAAEY
ncbi:signal peptidase I [Candidatus Daviesbacteria bacterium]|nr:signal peptidase I [Candidatus Daviesbacteria bacterium]